MQIIQAIILGLTQGLTEFIPVSSSGHLILVGHLIGFKDSGLTFDVATNIGTLTALLIFFRHDFLLMARSLFKKNEHSRLAWLLVLATVPAVISGVLLQTQAETIFRSDRLVAFNLLLVGIVMLAVDKLAKPKDDLTKMDAKRGLVIGLAQALAIIPGVSRSGATITAGLLQGFDYVAATRFSFLLSAPIIAGATLKVLAGGSVIQNIAADLPLYLAGIVASLVSGYWAIKFMLNYLKKHGLAIFAYYRIALGSLILIAWGFGV